MKLSQYDGTVAETSGIQSNAFGFQMNAKMYSIMIDKLYKNKPGAVIRELSCNARDSHVMAGTEDTPFEINLPTWLDKTFSIRDFGTGIPHSQFEEVYTNVGASTKEDSNTQIGAYGLGSKTPFCMSESFTVENWNGGEKSTWVCFKSSGFPQVTRVALEPSDEPSGLKVTFAFEEGDVSSFKQEVVEQLKFFQVKPKITGLDNIAWPKIPEFSSSDTYFNLSGHTSYVLMGGVGYPFTSSDLGISSYSTFSELYNLLRSPLCILADLGDVDIPPSRESLELTSKTKDFVISKLTKIHKDYVAEHEKKLDTLKTHLEVWKHIKSVNRHLINKVPSGVIKFDRGTKSIPTNLAYSYSWPCKYRNFKGVIRNHLREEWFSSPDRKVYLNDLGSGGLAHLKREGHKLTPNSIIIDVTSSVRRGAIMKACAEDAPEMKTHLDMDTALLSTVIGFPPKAVRQKKTAVPASQIFKLTDGNVYKPTIQRCSTEYTGDKLPDSGYYVEIAHWSTVSGSTAETIAKITSGLKVLPAPIYFVRSKTVPLLDQKKVLPIQQYFDKVRKTAIEELRNIAYLDAVAEATTVSFDRFFEEFIKQEVPHLTSYIRLTKKRQGLSSSVHRGSSFLSQYDIDISKIAQNPQTGKQKRYLKKLKQKRLELGKYLPIASSAPYNTKLRGQFYTALTEVIREVTKNQMNKGA